MPAPLLRRPAPAQYFHSLFLIFQIPLWGRYLKRGRFKLCSMVPYFLITLLLIFLLLSLRVFFLCNNPFIVSFLDLVNLSWQLSEIAASRLLCLTHIRNTMYLSLDLDWSNVASHWSSLIDILISHSDSSYQLLNPGDWHHLILCQMTFC